MAKNKVVNALDKGLKLLQDSFNVDNDFSDIIQELLYQATIIGNLQAKRLIDKEKDIEIIQENNLLTRINEITGQFSLLDSNVRVFTLADDLIKSLNNAKGWLESYQDYRRTLGQDVSGQLLALGTAILGRAVELCPIDTGYLRRSGTIIQTANSVTVGFYAPYAVYVHERIGLNHPVGQAKFLEVAAQEFLPSTTVWVEVVDGGGIALRIVASNIRW